MKSLKLTVPLLIISLVMNLSSCKKKIDESSPSLIGKWSIRSYTITNFENTGKEIDDTKGNNPRPTFEFSADGRFTSTLGGPNAQVINYNTNGDQVVFSEEIAFDHKDFTYVISGSILTMKRTQTYNISSTRYTENTTITLDRL